MTELTETGFSRARSSARAAPMLSAGIGTEVTVMSAFWTFIEVCFGDARKAEELVATSAARRELRVRSEAALARFDLWRRGSTSGR